MIEQLISAQGLQASRLVESSMEPLAANDKEVMRFNMEMRDSISDSVNNSISSTKTEGHLLQDVKSDSGIISEQLLQENTNANSVSNPLSKLDSSYRAIMSQMDQIPDFEKFMEIQQNEKPAAIRTNVEDIKSTDPAAEVKELLEQQREMRKVAGDFSKQIGQWHLKTQIWSANIKILTTVVGQASQGFKTLFRSAG